MRALIAATAGVFSLGFAPIVWFVHVTAGAPARGVGAVRALAAVLLGLAFVLGVVQMIRCLRRWPDSAGATGFAWLMVVWSALLAFITFRMAVALSLFAAGRPR